MKALYLSNKNMTLLMKFINSDSQKQVLESKTTINGDIVHLIVEKKINEKYTNYLFYWKPEDSPLPFE